MNDLPPLPKLDGWRAGETIRMDECQRRMTEYARAAVAAENEACAQECDALATTEGIAQRCAYAIRARRQEAALQRLADLSKEMGEEL
jgi:hypothetical protein